ncbi:MAG: M28 family peptidase [Gemmatimonadaceae bacterium]
MIEAEQAWEHLTVLAREPRPAGSAAEGRAREYCSGVLRECGFTISEETFEYSTLPGRAATPAIGLGWMATIALASYLGARDARLAPLVILIIGGIAMAASAYWLARYGVLELAYGRTSGVNLVATRGKPSVWLMAHLDSKSQPVPIGLRAAGVMLSIVVWLAALAVGAGQAIGAWNLPGIWTLLGVAGVFAGLPIAASVVGTRSPGAVDNASGVAAVLISACAIPREREMGVFLTSAEELGLAGARSLARDREPGVVINFDGCDDAGMIRLTYSGKRPQVLLEGLAAGAREAGLHVATGRLLPGVLLDGVALADGGWDVVTVSKGTLGTVARIHTARDSLAELRDNGRGAREAASLVSGTVMRMRFHKESNDSGG